MPNSKNKYKIVFSLRIHIELQKQGFKYLTEMKNPDIPQFTCCVYQATPELRAAFDREVKRGERNGE